MVEQRFATPGPVRLEIKVAVGEIDVETADVGESTVQLDGSPKLLEVTAAELSGDRLLVRHHQRFRFGLFDRLDAALRVHVRVPAGSRVEIVTASAEATLTGTIARVEAKSASGSVRVTGAVAGDARVRTVSGDVLLSHVGGDVDVRTVSGDVDAGSVDGSVTVKAVSGNVRIGSLREGRVDVQSVSGDVEVGVVPGTNLDVDAGTASGELTSEVPLSGAPSGDAGRTLVVRSKTVSGNFRVVRAA